MKTSTTTAGLKIKHEHQGRRHRPAITIAPVSRSRRPSRPAAFGRNHNRPALKVTTGIKAGGFGRQPQSPRSQGHAPPSRPAAFGRNHNRAGLKVRTGIKAGGFGQS